MYTPIPPAVAVLCAGVAARAVGSRSGGKGCETVKVRCPLRTVQEYHAISVLSITELLTNITELLTNITELLQKPYRVIKYE